MKYITLNNTCREGAKSGTVNSYIIFLPVFPSSRQVFKQHYFTISFSVLLFICCMLSVASAQPLNQKIKFTRQDTLRGTIGPERAWWDVRTYEISVEPNYQDKTIRGRNDIRFAVTIPGKNKIMQIDLQQPMEIDDIVFGSGLKKSRVKYTREGNVYWLDFGKMYFGKTDGLNGSVLSISFHGSPRVAKNPPWDGGWIFTKDEKGRPWMTVACQGLGASVWYPCKDHQSDEPDAGATLSMKVSDSLVAVGNGRLKDKKANSDGTTTWTWQVKSAINNYDIIPYIGKYVNFTDTLQGEKGKLDLSYWVLDYDLEKAKKQFGRDVKTMLRCFEYWFGPYPFYEDGYKLVETSHLGMEHQSAVAYGNKFMDGYLGRDLSNSGWGKTWDYIVVHESGHEWFGNNITSNDLADMWVHEGFTDYSETLFVECQYGKTAADEYARGLRRTIRNDKPIIGYYGVNQEGSGDMYNKGNNMLHTIRQVINNDELFRQILRGLNKDFYHRTVDSKDVEEYMSKKSGKDLSKIFDQYLRTKNIPALEYKTDGSKLSYRWSNCVDGFDMPVQIGTGKVIQLKPTTEWQESILPDGYAITDINKNFYITLKKID